MTLNGTFAKKNWPGLFSGNEFSVQFESETKSISFDYEYLSTLISEYEKSCISSPTNHKNRRLKNKIWNKKQSEQRNRFHF